MAQPCKTQVLKKVGREFDVDGIEIGDNPIRRGAERCQNVCFCYRKARNGPKTQRRLRQAYNRGTCFSSKRMSVLAIEQPGMIVLLQKLRNDYAFHRQSNHFYGFAWKTAILRWSIAKTNSLAQLCSSRYRIVTNLYIPSTSNSTTFFKTFVLYG